MTNKFSEIRARCDAATPGPWLQESEEGTMYDCPTCDGEGEIEGGKRIDSRDGWYGIVQCYGFMEHAIPNAEFIAHARTDIPLLLKALELACARIGNANLLSIPTTEETSPDYWLAKEELERIRNCSTT